MDEGFGIRLTRSQRLIQSVENHLGIRGRRDFPSNNVAREDINDECHIDEADGGSDVGEVSYPENVWRRCFELSVHLVFRARQCRVTLRRCYITACNSLYSNAFHKANNRTTGDDSALVEQVIPDFHGTISFPALLPEMSDPGHYKGITLCTVRRFRGIMLDRFVVVVSRWRDRQNLANRRDAKMLTVVVDEHDHLFRRRSRSAAAKKAEALRRISLACLSSRTSR